MTKDIYDLLQRYSIGTPTGYPDNYKYYKINGITFAMPKDQNDIIFVRYRDTDHFYYCDAKKLIETIKSIKKKYKRFID